MQGKVRKGKARQEKVREGKAKPGKGRFGKERPFTCLAARISLALQLHKLQNVSIERMSQHRDALLRHLQTSRH
jgi:hypothetical protein